MNLKGIGENCTRNMDCVYSVCTNNKCAAPSLRCPSNTPGDYSKPFFVIIPHIYKHGKLCMECKDENDSVNFLCSSPFKNDTQSCFSGFTIPLHTKSSLYWVLDHDCSGNGKCVFTDPSGNKLQSCTIFDTTCTATCSCPKFGGEDCSLDEHASLSRNNVR